MLGPNGERCWAAADFPQNLVRQPCWGWITIGGALNFTLAPVQVYALGSTLTTSFACAVASFAPVEVRAELTAPVYDASGAVSVYLATLSGEVYSATPVPESIRSTWEVECHQTL